MTLKEQLIRSAMQKCRHFNGIQKKVCDAGVCYEGHEAGHKIPCLPAIVSDRPAWPCDKFEILSQAEAEIEADARIDIFERNMKGRAAAHDHAHKRGLGKGRGGTGVVLCPVCEGGRISYSVASTNGHMWFRCSTTGCVSGIE